MSAKALGRFLTETDVNSKGNEPGHRCHWREMKTILIF